MLQYKLVASLRYVTGEGSGFFFIKLILAAIVLIAIIYWFFGTELGAAIRATGCNPQMASAQGINTSFNKVLALMISNGLVGLCGGIYAPVSYTHLTELGGMDYIIARKVLKKFESMNVSFVRDEITGLISYIDKTFGEDGMPDSKEYLRRIQNLY